jgi:hypothetical protein
MWTNAFLFSLFSVIKVHSISVLHVTGYRKMLLNRL